MFEISEETQRIIDLLKAGKTPDELKQINVARPGGIREAAKIWKYQRIAAALRAGKSYSQVQGLLKVSAADVAKVSAMLKEAGKPIESPTRSTFGDTSGSGSAPTTGSVGGGSRTRARHLPAVVPPVPPVPPSPMPDLARAQVEVARIEAKKTVMLAKLKASEEAAKLGRERLRQQQKAQQAKERAAQAEAKRLQRKRAGLLAKYDKEKEVLDSYFGAFAKELPGAEVLAEKYDKFLQVIGQAMNKLGAALRQLGHRHHPLYTLGRKIEEILGECREANFLDGSGFFSDDDDKVRLDFPVPAAIDSPLVRAKPLGLRDLVQAFAGYRLK